MEAQGKRVVARDRGEREIGSCCSMGIKFQSSKIKKCPRNLLNIVLIVNNTALHAWNFVKMVDLMLWIYGYIQHFGPLT